LSFEVLREVVSALYAPKWAKKAHSRVDDQDIRFELGVAWFGAGWPVDGYSQHFDTPDGIDAAVRAG
jgi:hypothetical protein